MICVVTQTATNHLCDHILCRTNTDFLWCQSTSEQTQIMPAIFLESTPAHCILCARVCSHLCMCEPHQSVPDPRQPAGGIRFPSSTPSQSSQQPPRTHTGCIVLRVGRLGSQQQSVSCDIVRKFAALSLPNPYNMHVYMLLVCCGCFSWLCAFATHDMLRASFRLPSINFRCDARLALLSTPTFTHIHTHIWSKHQQQAPAWGCVSLGTTHTHTHVRVW